MNTTTTRTIWPPAMHAERYKRLARAINHKPQTPEQLEPLMGIKAGTIRGYLKLMQNNGIVQAEDRAYRAGELMQAYLEEPAT